MNDQRKHVAHGMAHERSAALHWLRNDEQLRRAVEFELNLGTNFAKSDVRARNICNLIADNLEGSEHWEGSNDDNDAQSRTDDTRTRAAV